VPSSSTPSCDYANVIEENARLKAAIAKSSIPQSEKSLNDLLNNQRSNYGKGGLGYVHKPKENKDKKKKTKPTQAKKNVVGGDATRGKATHDDFAGTSNPHYM
jgi:hypothetical protein